MKKLKQKLKNQLGEKRVAVLKKALKIGRVVKNAICWILIALLTVAIVVFMVNKVSGATPTVFGYSIHRIVSGSMVPELQIGDVILNKDISDTAEINIGDIITFQGDSRFDNQKVTHRVLVAPYDDGRGNIVLTTKGDANETDDGEINFSDVESKLVLKVTFLKSIYNFFFSPWGFIIFIFLLLLIFFDEIINIIRLSVHGAEQDESESFEEIVERVKREQLEEMRKKQLAEAMPEQSEAIAVDNADQNHSDAVANTLNANKRSLKETKKDKKNDKKNASKVQKNKTESPKKQSKSNNKKQPNKKKSQKKKKKR